MIWLFTDFTWKGPYLGQMRAALVRRAPGVPVLDLMHDVPAFGIEAAAHLLAACTGEAAAGDVFVCVVDPGVGTRRRAVMLKADDCWFVGPGNGLLEIVAARAERSQWWEISWEPERLSASFHGRDLFAPVAARLALGDPVDTLGRSMDAPRGMRGGDLAEIVYIDGFGNAMTGIRGDGISTGGRLGVGARFLEYRRTFGEAEPGEAFWYVNSLGLVEIAANGISVVETLQLSVGDPLTVEDAGRE